MVSIRGGVAMSTVAFFSCASLQVIQKITVPLLVTMEVKRYRRVAMIVNAAT